MFLISNNRNPTQIYFVPVASKPGCPIDFTSDKVHLFNEILISVFSVLSLSVHCSFSVSLRVPVCVSVCLSAPLSLSPCRVSHCIAASRSLFFLYLHFFVTIYVHFFILLCFFLYLLSAFLFLILSHVIPSLFPCVCVCLSLSVVCF